jgi:outer membrane protein TolC
MRYKAIWSLYTLFAVLCLVCSDSAAQEKAPVYLQLENLLEMGGANNLTIAQYRRQQDLAQADLARAREWWLPEIYAGFQNQQLWGAAMNADGRFFLDVNRQNFWAGLGVDARWNFAEGIYGVKAARLKAEASEYQTQAQRNQLLLQMLTTYYDFLTAQLTYHAYQDMALQADTIAAQLQLQVEAGLRYQSEVLMARGNHKHLQVQALAAKNGYLQEEARLVNLLHLKPGTRIVSVDTLLAPLNLVPEAEWQMQQENPVANRPEYRHLHTELESLRVARKTTTTGLLLPELSVGTYTSYTGRLNGPVRPMFLDEYPHTQALYPTSALNVSLMWRIPAGRLVYQGRLRQFDAQVALAENAVDQLRSDVQEEVSAAQALLLTAHEQLDLAEQGQQLAREAVQQSIQRQQLGTAQAFEVFQAQEFYLRARLDYLKVVAAYNKAQYSFHVASGNDL